MLGDVFGAALKLFGDEKAEDSAYAQQQQNIALQREFAQHGIRWKVADAKAAGLHPLFALGGAGASFAPNPIYVGGQGDTFGKMGQSVGRAIEAQMDTEQRQVKELQRKVLESQIGENDARAAYYRSQATRPGVNQAGVGFPTHNESGAVVSPYVEVGEPSAIQLDPTEDYGSGFPGKFDMIKAKPVEIESSSPDAPWSTAGPARPGFQRFRVTKYLEMVLPTNQEGWSEGIESVPMWMYPMVYQANVDKYGPNFWRVAIQELGARNPFAIWLSRQGHDSGSARGGAVSGRIRNYDGSYR